MRDVAALPYVRIGVAWLTICAAFPVHPAAADLATESVPAFPGAEGFGARTKGGRGGKVFAVSNLEDSGPGSLRSCAEAVGPRVCVFRTGGQIVLESSIEIDHPFLTIAGQTAPGGGIALRMRPDNPSTPVKIRTHDVIVRYLRIRPGASHVPSDTQDALTIANRDSPVYNVIIDHSSLSWASDEVANVWYDAHDITFQWNIISEGLDCINHSDGCNHSKGLLIGSEGSRDVSVHHNLFAHHSERSPRIAMSGVADIVNNVVYNSRYSGAQVSDRYARARVNFVHNYMKRGKDSQSDFMLALKSKPDEDHGFEIYVEGNVGLLSPEPSPGESFPIKEFAEDWESTTRHVAPPVTDHGCATFADCRALEEVLKGAGATLPKRDAVDRRIIAEVETGTGKIIDAQSEAACRLPCTEFLTPLDYLRHGIRAALDRDGWPVLEPGEPYPDEDGDGMDDEWEVSKGLSDTSADGDGHALHPGYTNLEVFLDHLVSRVRR